VKISAKNNIDGKPAKRRNHTVPKCLLKNWLEINGKKVGHWVLDCESGEIKFHEGGEANFAVSEYIYVPSRHQNGKDYRDESLEDWFSGGEDKLSKIIDALRKGNAIKPENVYEFIESVIALGFRSSYEIEEFKKILTSRSKESCRHSTDEYVFHYLKKIYKAKISQCKNWDYIILTGVSEKLLICDRPTYDMSVGESPEDALAIPLAPDLLLFGSPPKDHTRENSTLSVIETKGNFAQNQNAMTIMRARKFIVGQHEQLQRIKHLFTSDEFEKRKKKDSFVIQII